MKKTLLLIYLMLLGGNHCRPCNNFTVYSVSVPTSVVTVILPTWLSGDYEIRLLTGESYYFYGDVTF